MAFFTMQQPPDNTRAFAEMAASTNAAMMHNSDNMKMVGLAQIGAQQLQSEQMYNLGRRQINADVELGREKLDAKIEIATMNYKEFVLSEEDRHQERIAEMDVRKHEIDVARSADNSLA